MGLLSVASHIDVTTPSTSNVNLFPSAGAGITIGGPNTASITMSVPSGTFTVDGTFLFGADLEQASPSADPISIFAPNTGTVTLGGQNVQVGGASSPSVVTISAPGSATTVKGTLNVDEAVTFDTTLGVTGAITFSSDTSYASNADLVGSSATDAHTVFSSTTGVVTVGGSSVVIGAPISTNAVAVDISAPGSATTVKGTLNVDEAVTFDTTLGVTGATTFSGDLVIESGASITCLATQAPASQSIFGTSTGTITIGGPSSTLSLSGSTEFGGSIEQSTPKTAPIGVFDDSTGTVSLGGGPVTISVSNKATTVAGSLTVDQATTLSSTLSVSQATTLSGTVNVGSTATFSGDIVAGDTSTTKNLLATHASTINFGGSSSSIVVQGNFQVQGTATYSDASWSTSDRRLKENIRPLREEGSILKKLTKIDGVSYFWDKNDPSKARYVGNSDRRQVGLVAQQVKGQFPDLVTVLPNSTYMAVAYLGFVPVALEAIKELASEVQEMREGRSLDPTALGLKASDSESKRGHRESTNKAQSVIRLLYVVISGLVIIIIILFWLLARRYWDDNKKPLFSAPIMENVSEQVQL